MRKTENIISRYYNEKRERKLKGWRMKGQDLILRYQRSVSHPRHWCRPNLDLFWWDKVHEASSNRTANSRLSGIVMKSVRCGLRRI